MTKAMEGSDFDAVVDPLTSAPISLQRDISMGAATSAAQLSTPTTPADYVLVFRSRSQKPLDNEKHLETLLTSLYRVGLDVECRYGGKDALLVFVRCPRAKLIALVSRARFH